MRVHDSIAGVCELVPGLLRAALILLPEAELIAGIGGESFLDHEPLVRSAARCLTVRANPPVNGGDAVPFVEFLFVLDAEIVVVQGGRRSSQLALAVACSREPNVALVLSSTRAAMAWLESSIDLLALGVAP